MRSELTTKKTQCICREVWLRWTKPSKTTQISVWRSWSNWSVTLKTWLPVSKASSSTLSTRNPKCWEVFTQIRVGLSLICPQSKSKSITIDRVTWSLQTTISNTRAQVVIYTQQFRTSIKERLKTTYWTTKMMTNPKCSPDTRKSKSWMKKTEMTTMTIMTTWNEILFLHRLPLILGRMKMRDVLQFLVRICRVEGAAEFKMIHKINEVNFK